MHTRLSSRGLADSVSLVYRAITGSQSHESKDVHPRAVPDLASWLVCLTSAGSGRGQVGSAFARPGKIILVIL